MATIAHRWQWNSLLPTYTLLTARLAALSSSPVPPAGPFVGRGTALAQLTDLVRAGRLVTVWGTSGIGKTRLARELVARWRNGPTAFVDLTETADADDIVVAVGAALGVHAPHRDSVADAIARRGPMLLVLDNVEQVVADAADVVGTWLAASPDARFVATSRELLRVAGEVALELPPLALPAGPDDDAGALQLWLSERRLGEPGYAPDRAELATVCEILRELDGIPLAIQLAAARARMLAPSDLLARLSRRFELLSVGRRGAPARQATMRGAIDWSWDLLAPWERDALAQCSAFRGGFGVDSAEAVVDLSAHPDAPAVLDALQSLRDKSLLRADGGRLRAFVSIRDYAADKLRAAGAAEDVERRAGRHFADLAARLRAEVDGPAGVAALERIAAERENLAAVAARADVAPADAVEAVAALDVLAWTRGPVGGNLELLDRCVAACDAAGARASLVHALEIRGLTRGSLGELERGDSDLSRARALAESDGDDRLLARVLASAAWIHLRAGRLDDNARLLARARALAAAVGDRRLEGIVVGSAGAAPKERGQFDQAEALYREALAIHREVGNRRFEGVAYTRLTILYLEQGRFADLREVAERALAIHREFGSRYVEALVLTALGAAHHAEGRLREASEAYRAAIPLEEHMGEQRVYGSCLGYYGLAQFELGHVDRAVEFLGRAHAVLGAAREHRHHALFLAFHGGVAAALDRADDAADLLGRAARVLAAHPDDKAETVLAFMHALGDGLAASAALDNEQRPGGGGEVSSARSIDVRIAVRLLARRVAVAVSDVADALVVHPAGEWFAPPGTGDRVDCRRRHPMRRLLVALATQRVHQPGAPLSADQLIEAGWPNEAMKPESAQNRLYVTLNRLRELGLRGYLAAVDGGYVLDPGRPVRFDAQ